jgi:hypothetical protein
LDVNTDNNQQKEISGSQNNYVSIQTVKNIPPQQYNTVNTTNQNYNKTNRNKNVENNNPYTVNLKQNNDENTFSHKTEDELSRNVSNQKENSDESQNQQNKTYTGRKNDLKELRKVMAAKEEKSNARQQ